MSIVIALLISGLLALADPAASPIPDLTPPPAPPITVLGCSGDYQSISNPNLKVGISFINEAQSDAVEVNFDILLLDSSAHMLEHQVEVMRGHFAPNVMIEPKRSSLGDAILTQPDYPGSPAWIVPNHHGSDTAHIFCRVNSAVFADGSTWSRTP
jgi:hypothetical protein